jgi:hypothetical protein
MASASCVIVITVSTTTPNNATAATKAITTNVVLLFISKTWKGTYFLRISAIRLQDEIIL